jgi:hypothetical protein
MGELKGFSIISVLIHPLCVDQHCLQNGTSYLRAKSIDADPSRCPFKCRHFGETNKSMFGRDVSRDTRTGIITGYTSDVDNGSPVFDSFHLLLDAVERADDVDIDLRGLSMDSQSSHKRESYQIGEVLGIQISNGKDLTLFHSYGKPCQQLINPA